MIIRIGISILQRDNGDKSAAMFLNGVGMSITVSEAEKVISILKLALRKDFPVHPGFSSHEYFE